MWLIVTLCLPPCSHIRLLQGLVNKFAFGGATCFYACVHISKNTININRPRPEIMDIFPPIKDISDDVQLPESWFVCICEINLASLSVWLRVRLSFLMDQCSEQPPAPNFRKCIIGEWAMLHHRMKLCLLRFSMNRKELNTKQGNAETLLQTTRSVYT